MILLTGSTGKTGGEVARQMAAAGVPFRALVRNPEKSQALVALGAEIVLGDMGDQKSLRKALAGIERALLIMPNGEVQLQLENGFIDAAAGAGVRHVVKLSSLEAIQEATTPITRMHLAAEDHLRKSGLTWTMIRPTFFMQTFLGMAAGIRASGLIMLPAGAGTVAPTDLRDVGGVICRALIESSHEFQSYDLTGPQLLTMTQVAARFSSVLGREIRYVDQPMDEFAARLVSVKLAPWRVAAVCKEFESIANGVINHTTDTLARLLGKPPVSLQQFILDYRGAFI